jgi:glycosyltransferase involved in cell wall biosynthesis
VTFQNGMIRINPFTVEDYLDIIFLYGFATNTMKKILIISYMFPPIAGAGTLRPLKFAKYLPEYGVTPIVFCPQKAFWKAYDEKLLDLPYLKKIKIFRCGIKRLQQYYHLRYQKGIKSHPYYYWMGLKYFCLLDFFSAWYFECRLKALEIAKKEKVDCVITTSPPHSIHFFGMFLKKMAGIPWLMDMRDAMVDDPNKPQSLVYQIQAPVQRLFEKRFLSSASAAIAVSDPIIASIKKRYQDPKIQSKLWTITNGFDTEDFGNTQRISNQRNVLLITYTGSFMGRQTPEYFLSAMQQLIEEKSLEPSDLLIRFIGHYDAAVLDIFNRFREKVPIEILGFQPYDKSLWHQMNSDLLLLIVNTETQKGANQTMTGKFFEYIGAQRPIFALVPDGPLKDTITRGKFGQVVPPQNTAEIGTRFLTFYRQWKTQGELSYHPNLQLKNQFTRKALTGELAAIIRKVIR